MNNRYKPIYIYIYIYICGCIYIYIYRERERESKRKSFDPSFKRPTCLATLKSCDTTKQFVCG